MSSGSVARLQEGYSYDALGNATLQSQFWDTGGFIETLEYDDLNRLKTSKIGSVEQSYTYDLSGNMTSKTGAGTYSYPAPGPAAVRPHAVTSVSSLSSQFSYDNNGNRLGGGGNSATWTSFDMPLRLAKGGVTATFVYGPEHQRTSQTRSDGSTAVNAGAQEVETKAGVTTVKTYWPNGIGVEIDRGTSRTEMSWTHLDRLGSPVALTNETGVIREKLEYDVWGKRRSADDNNSTPDSLDGKTDNRGFTGHEMLDQLDLVHMNGRVYNPFIGRFLSADPLVNDPVNGQSYNRYAYVLNNPTNLTDPTGFSELPVGQPATTLGGGGDWQKVYVAEGSGAGAVPKPDAVPSGTAANRSTQIAGSSATEGSANSKTYFIGGAADKYKEFGQGPTNIMGDVQKEFVKNAPAGADSAYFGYQDRKELVSDITAVNTNDSATQINLVGHSRGAALAINMASNELAKAKISVNLLIAIDPVGTRFTTPGLWMPNGGLSNVSTFINLNANPKSRDITDRIAIAGGNYGEGARKFTPLFFNVNYNHGQAGPMLRTPIALPNTLAKSAWDYLIQSITPGRK